MLRMCVQACVRVSLPTLRKALLNAPSQAARLRRRQFTTSASSVWRDVKMGSTFARSALMVASSTGLVLYCSSKSSLQTPLVEVSCHADVEVDTDAPVDEIPALADEVKTEPLTDADGRPVVTMRTFFGQLLMKDLPALSGAVVAALGAAYANVLIPLRLGDLVDVLAKLTQNSNADTSHLLVMPIVSLLVVYGAHSLLTTIYISLLSHVGEKFAERMRQKLFSSLVHQDIEFFDATRVGSCMDRLTTDVQETKSAFKQVISIGLRTSTQVVGSLVAMCKVSVQLTVVVGLSLVGMIAIGNQLAKLLRALSRAAQEQQSVATAAAQECLSGMRTVRAFASEEREVDRYAAELAHARILSSRLGLGIGILQGATNLAVNASVLGVLSAGGYMIGRGEISSGGLMSFLVATQSIQRAMTQFSMMFSHVVRGSASAFRVYEYAVLLQPKIPLTGGLKLHGAQGHALFKDVSFHYANRENQSVLNNISLELKPATTVALVGSSGAGKSTVAALLERFYEPTSGQILVDGQDIRTIDPSWLRGQLMGFINQEPMLFATTIFENIRYGQPSATEEQVKLAAAQANAHDFIEKFPDGYNTIVGERGSTLSGGQRQRIAIARALLKNPKILVLDEATSALDAQSEAIVQEALQRLMVGRTVLVIAHRLSTVMNADLICVMDRGRIIEQGTHQELMKRKGAYAQLVLKQMSGGQEH